MVERPDPTDKLMDELHAAPGSLRARGMTPTTPSDLSEALAARLASIEERVAAIEAGDDDADQ